MRHWALIKGGNNTEIFATEKVFNRGKHFDGLLFMAQQIRI